MNARIKLTDTKSIHINVIETKINIREIEHVGNIVTPHAGLVIDGRELDRLIKALNFIKRTIS